MANEKTKEKAAAEKGAEKKGAEEKGAAEKGAEEKGAEEKAAAKKGADVKPIKKAVVQKAINELQIMDRCKTDRIYKNSNGEYFTNHNLAVLSEKGDLKKVSEINRNVVELIINGK